MVLLRRRGCERLQKTFPCKTAKSAPVARAQPRHSERLSSFGFDLVERAWTQLSRSSSTIGRSTLGYASAHARACYRTAEHGQRVKSTTRRPPHLFIAAPEAKQISARPPRLVEARETWQRLWHSRCSYRPAALALSRQRARGPSLSSGESPRSASRTRLGSRGDEMAQAKGE